MDRYGATNLGMRTGWRTLLEEKSSVQPPGKTSYCVDELMRSYRRGDRMKFKGTVYRNWKLYIDSNNVTHVTVYDDGMRELTDGWDAGKFRRSSDASTGGRERGGGIEIKGKFYSQWGIEIDISNVIHLKVNDDREEGLAEGLEVGDEMDIKLSFPKWGERTAAAETKQPPGKFVEYSTAFISSCKEGDRIEIKRGMYSHWGIYVGNRNIVHLTEDVDEEKTGGAEKSKSSRPKFSFAVSKASVGKAFGNIMIQNLKAVADGDKLRVNNKMDSKCEPRSRYDVWKNAMRMVGKKVRYHLLKFNCKHFADMLTYEDKTLALRAKEREVEQS